MAEMDPRAYVAEFVATFALVFIGGGSIVANAFLLDLGQAGIGLLGVALAHGLVLGIMVSATMHISGGHVNPAVTVGAWVARKIDNLNAVLYIVSQLLGGIVGGVLLLASFQAPFPGAAQDPVNLGTPNLGLGVGLGTGILVEAVLTFFLVFTVFATGIDKRGSGQVAGFAIGLVLTFDILVGGPLTGAAMNPARALGTAVPAAFFANHLVYWIGPLIGGIVAGLVYGYLLLQEE